MPPRWTLIVPIVIATLAAFSMLAITYRQYNGVEAKAARLDSPMSGGVGDRGPRQRPVRLVVSPVLSPTRDFSVYQQLGRYLQRRIGRPVEMLRRRTHQEVSDVLIRGEAEGGFIDASLFVPLSRQGTVTRVAVPEVNGSTHHCSYLIVRTDSNIHRWEELAGKTIAIADPLSSTGELYLDYMLQSAGRDPRTFFGRVLYTYSHDASLLAVTRDLVHAASVDNLIWEKLDRSDPLIRGRTRVIHRSPSLGMDPVVARADLSSELRRQLREALVGMARDDEGRRILAGIGIDGFRTDAHLDYGFIALMLEELRR